MEKFVVYVFVNITLQEVYFGMNSSAGTDDAQLPEEILHWDFCSHAIANPVMMETGISKTEAVAVIRELQEKALRNPQGKTILMNRLVMGNDNAGKGACGEVKSSL